MSRIEACRPAPPGTCIATDLTVTSTGPLPTFPSFVGQLLGLLQQLLFGGLRLG